MTSIAFKSLLLIVALGAIQFVSRRPRRVSHGEPRVPRGRRGAAIDSAAAATALAQRLTGSDSGPYSGTPFPRTHDAGRSAAAGGLSEGPCHERGIIDHS